MRVLIVGLGNQGRKRMHVAGGEVVATVDPVVPDADYRDVRQVPADSFDVALVCTPDEAKVDLLRRFLSMGKHVLVEKPLLAPRPEALSELIALARSRRAACYTAYNHRFEPNIRRLKERIDSGVLGKIYVARLFYGNGTATDVRQSPWRDQGLGVLSDLGSHLLDLVLFLLGPLQGRARLWHLGRFENRAPDHAAFGLVGCPVVECEVTLLSWRNAFAIDLLGEKGSAHITGLCKWGPSTLSIRRRVYPSGPPQEETQQWEEPDRTWNSEYVHFKLLCEKGGTNLENDVWIQSALEEMKISEGRADAS